MSFFLPDLFPRLLARHDLSHLDRGGRGGRLKTETVDQGAELGVVHAGASLKDILRA